MKINEQSVSSVSQKLTKASSNNNDFEHLINTPTKQNSGDEYYWQHQSHLQKSALTFNSRIPGISSEPQLSHYKEKPAFTKALNHDEPPGPKNQNPDKSGQFKTSNAPLLNYLQLQKITRGLQLDKTLASIQNPEAKTSLKIKTNSPQPTIKTTERSQNNPPTYKNHHIFINNNQVELSLNTNSFNPEEQLKLIQLIKKTLKPARLALRQLIINGEIQ